MLEATMGDALNRVPTAQGSSARYIRAAVADMHRIRPRILTTHIQLIAGVERYAMPFDAVMFYRASWVARWSAIEAWDRIGQSLPVAEIEHADDGSRELVLSPAPTQALIWTVSSAHTVRYKAQHTVDETGTTVAVEDRRLIILRAEAELMKEIALGNAGKGGNWKGGDRSMPRNATPQATYDRLMADWLAS